MDVIQLLPRLYFIRFPVGHGEPLACDAAAGLRAAAASQA
jgi:hypothetical protein